MKPELKQQIEEAATVRGGGQEFINADFESGAEWLYNQGYRFNEEDMREAYSAGAEDEYTGRNFDRWLKEKGI